MGDFEFKVIIKEIREKKINKYHKPIPQKQPKRSRISQQEKQEAVQFLNNLNARKNIRPPTIDVKPQEFDITKDTPILNPVVGHIIPDSPALRRYFAAIMYGELV